MNLSKATAIKLACIVLIGMLLLIIKSIVDSILTVTGNAQTVESLKQEVLSEKREHQFLTEQLHYVKTDDFVEQEARTKLGLVKEGEKIVIAPPPEQKHTDPSLPEQENWEKWLKLFF